ncbi:Fructosamine/Ketosamine-3-kinase [Biscogniauxia sp. FL1348]|nr:Fructosamine/Ketosamine-3-kinase [Biscogniauxia sp. FL1348]
MSQLDSGAIELDQAIIDVLPAGDEVIKVEQYGTSSWALTARVDVKSKDGSRKAYFLKILRTADAEARVTGEYAAMLEIYRTLPTFAPMPRGHGKCHSQNAHFFICDYLTIDHELPDATRLGEKLAELHRRSLPPTGKFGFHVTTYDGKLPLNTTWDSSWTSFFKKLMYDVYQLDVQVNGFWDELDTVMKITLDRLIPRLLDPLTSDGRSIKPCLIHGDLWESNIGTDVHTGEIYIFDACAYYAHHEKEVGIWRCAHHKMNDKKYRSEYFKNFEPSEPVEEFDDRNRLYSVETLIINSAHFPGAKTRQLAVSELKYLVGKYLE